MGLCRFKKNVGTGEQKSGVFILGVQDMKTFGSPPPPSSLHMCRYLFETFPPVPRQLFHILSAPLLSGFIQTTRVRGAQPCGAAQILPFFVSVVYVCVGFLFSFFGTWQIINGGLAALRRSSERTHAK